MSRNHKAEEYEYNPFVGVNVICRLPENELKIRFNAPESSDKIYPGGNNRENHVLQIGDVVFAIETKTTSGNRRRKKMTFDRTNGQVIVDAHCNFNGLNHEGYSTSEDLMDDIRVLGVALRNIDTRPGDHGHASLNFAASIMRICNISGDFTRYTFQPGDTIIFEAPPFNPHYKPQYPLSSGIPATKLMPILKPDNPKTFSDHFVPLRINMSRTFEKGGSINVPMYGDTSVFQGYDRRNNMLKGKIRQSQGHDLKTHSLMKLLTGLQPLIDRDLVVVQTPQRKTYYEALELFTLTVMQRFLSDENKQQLDSLEKLREYFMNGNLNLKKPDDEDNPYQKALENLSNVVVRSKTNVFDEEQIPSKFESIDLFHINLDNLSNDQTISTKKTNPFGSNDQLYKNAAHYSKMVAVDAKDISSINSRKESEHMWLACILGASPAAGNQSLIQPNLIQSILTHQNPDLLGEFIQEAYLPGSSSAYDEQLEQTPTARKFGRRLAAEGDDGAVFGAYSSAKSSAKAQMKKSYEELAISHSQRLTNTVWAMTEKHKRQRVGTCLGYRRAGRDGSATLAALVDTR